MVLEEELKHVERWFATADIERRLLKMLPTAISRKSDLLSQQTRSRGNDAYRRGAVGAGVNGACVLAWRLYSESAMQAESQQLLALALANRSAALLRLAHFRDCVQDIEWALQLDYKPQLRHKLYLRLARCHVMLRQWRQYRLALDEYRSLVNKLDVSPTQRAELLEWYEQVEREEKLTSSCASRCASSNYNIDVPIPRVTPAPHADMSCLSSLVELKHDDQNGRHLRAVKHISAGTTLLVERPFCCVVPGDRFLQHCYHCLRQTYALLPCTLCCDVGFCSEACRSQAAAGQHSAATECGWVRPLLAKMGVAHNALRMLTTVGPAVVSSAFAAITETASAADATEAVPVSVAEAASVTDATETAPVSDATEVAPAVSATEAALDVDAAEAVPAVEAVARRCTWPPGIISRGLHDTCDLQAGCRCFSDRRLSCSPCSAVAASGDADLARYRAVFHLATNMHHCQPHDLRQYSHAAALLAVFVRERGWLPCVSGSSPAPTPAAATGSSPAPTILSVAAALLLRHILQLVANAVSVTQLLEVMSDEAEEMSVVEPISQVRVATGIFPTASYMNHSCDPSVALSFYGSTMVVRTLKAIKSGDQIFHCYGPHFARRRTADRVKRLHEQYYFQCRCDHCTLPHLTGFVDELDGLRCLSCGDVTRPVSDVINSDGDVIPSPQRVCVKCKSTADYSRQSHLVAETLSKIDAKDSNGGLSISQLLSMRRRVLNVAFESHECLALLDDALSSKYMQQGELEESVLCLRRAVKRSKRRYRADSIEVSHVLLQLADVLAEMRQRLLSELPRRRTTVDAELIESLERARGPINIEYGEWSEMSRQLSEKISAIKTFTNLTVLCR